MSERIVAVVPIRSLRNGKSRLTDVLDPDQREVLVRQTAWNVVTAARRSGAVETILVVSPDPETLTWAAALDPRVVALAQPPDRPGLNGAIETGRDWALNVGAPAMMSLFADLPFLTADDIRNLVSYAAELVLGPDRRGEGTNAMLLRLVGPSTRFRFAFGEGSLDRHCAEAHRLGLSAAVHRANGIGFDLDTPDDWNAYLLVATERVMTRDLTLATCEAGAG